MLDVVAARRIAATYPPEARFVPVWEREACLSETQQLAWLIRFDPEAAEAMSANSVNLVAEKQSCEDAGRFIPHCDSHIAHTSILKKESHVG